MQVGNVIQAAKNEERRKGAWQATVLQALAGKAAAVGRLSRILDPGFYLSRIPDPTTAKKSGGEIFLSYFSCIHKYHKNESYLFLNR
jgi:hypothetical protein